MGAPVVCGARHSAYSPAPWPSLSGLTESVRSIYERDKLSRKTENTAETINNISKIELPAESRQAFRKAMKIAYFKEFNKKGLITDEELEKLIALQYADKTVTKSA